MIQLAVLLAVVLWWRQPDRPELFLPSPRGDSHRADGAAAGQAAPPRCRPGQQAMASPPRPESQRVDHQRQHDQAHGGVEPAEPAVVEPGRSWPEHRAYAASATAAPVSGPQTQAGAKVHGP